jgi:hypothetical protein
MKVLVERTQEIHGTCYVFVRISSSNFVLTDVSTLAGVPIRKWIDQPRKLKDDGTQDKDVFVFALQTTGDAHKISVGSMVELVE